MEQRVIYVDGQKILWKGDGMGDREQRVSDRMELRHIIRSIACTDRMHHCCIEKRVQQLGIHRSQHMILMYLAHNEQVPSQKELAKVFNVSTAAIANTMKSLEKSGYICRVADKEDTRKNIVNITEKGRSIVESSKIEFDAVDKEMFKGVTEEQLKVFCEVLDICKSNLQGLDGAESDEQILKCERMEQK